MARDYTIDYKKCWWGREKSTLDYKKKLTSECEEDKSRNCKVLAERIAQMDDFEQKFEYKRLGAKNWPSYGSGYWAKMANQDTTRKNNVEVYDFMLGIND